MKEVELYSILKYLLIPILSIVFLFILYDTANMHIQVLAYFIAILVTSIISFLIWTSKSQFFKIKIDYSSNNNILKFSFPFFISSSMLLLLQWIDIILLGYLNQKI